MSKLGHHNFFRRPSVTDGVVRCQLLRREDARFQEEAGFDLDHEEDDYSDWEPDWAAIYDHYQAGTLDEYAQQNRYDDYYDPGYADWLEKQAEREAELAWEARDPMEDKAKAEEILRWNAIEQKWEQEDLLWEIYKHGFTIPPVFAERVRELPVRGTW
jgi:hypothetical protein